MVAQKEASMQATLVVVDASLPMRRIHRETELTGKPNSPIALALLLF